MVDFALLPPTEELVGKRVIQCHLGIAQREEARQGIRIECCKFIRSHPAQERLGFFGMRGSTVHANRNVSVIADIACVTCILHIGREDAHVEGGILFKQTDFP